MEKYKLLLRITILALLIVSSVVWTRKAPISVKVPSKSPEITEAGVVTEIKGNEPPQLNYTLPLVNGFQLSVNVNISSIEEPEYGAYWCATPFLLNYRGSAKASILNKYGKVEDEITLTPPSLVVGKPPNYDYYYYKTYDLDGDGDNYEFFVLNYMSCNSNWVEVVKADTKTHKFVTLPFLVGGEEKDKILTGPNKDDLTFFPAQLSTKTYDMINGTFSKKEFTYKNGVFVQTSKL